MAVFKLNMGGGTYWRKYGAYFIGALTALIYKYGAYVIGALTALISIQKLINCASLLAEVSHDEAKFSHFCLVVRDLC